MLELQERVTELENWKDGKGLIIYGAGNTFCSGSDLNAVKGISNSQASSDTNKVFGEKRAFWYSEVLFRQMLHYASAAILHASHRVELLTVVKMLAAPLSHGLSVIVIDS